MNRSLLIRFAFFLAVTISTAAPSTYAVVADAGHRPFSADVPNVDGSPTPRRQFREPYVEISNNPANPTNITVYTVARVHNNPGYGEANQNGGTLFYKGLSQQAWQPVPLGFHANEGDFQYWKASFSSATFAANEVIQYYFQLTFSSGAENTFIYAGSGHGDLSSQVTNSQAAAATNAFTIRNRPAWIFHANNRVVVGSDMQFWTKVGYIGDPANSATKWATNGALYYTTDGSVPTGSFGQPSGSTQVVSFNYDHPDNNNTQNGGSGSIAGTPMWWVATIPGLLNAPVGTSINYRISFWNTSSQEEKFAENNAGANNTTFSFSNGHLGDPVLTVNGTSANYTTTHLFVNEATGDAPALTMIFEPGAANVDPTTVQVYTNLNRRDKATLLTNGVEEGIQPPSGDVVGTDDAHYYKGYVMSNTAPGHYELTLPASKTGAYRLTARYKTVDPNTHVASGWQYYTSAGRRDHAIVVSPTKARELVLYELNTLNANATGTQDFQRGSFADLSDSSKRLNLDYIKNLGCNFVWFQPIHPNGIAGRQTDPDTGAPYEVGSPYAVKNFYDVMALMSRANNRPAAMTEFQQFVAAADAKGVGVMLDAPFNHTSYDAELAQKGVDLISPGNSPLDEIRNKEARFFSLNNSYYDRASSSGNIAVAPDRGDFGKFGDTYDVFYGSYSALVNHNPDDNGAYNNESDTFFYDDPDWTNTDLTIGGQPQNITKNVWKYFADYLIYWLDQTGGTAANLANNPDAGIDALRADFGQGLPPQCWEYIVNKTRTRKWNFVFMTESLDGGAVTYRSNRHFDILNENIVFPFKAATSAQSYRDIFDQRRGAYGQGLVLMNSTSHDEENYDDPFQALIRYTVSGAIDGVPMVFYGQENGISRTFGFDRYETNFGKQIPHFKKFNSLGPILGNRTFGLDQLFPVYAGIGLARQFSAALKSSNRYYLNQVGGSIQANIFSVAKYQTAGGAPGKSDVVFAFANLDRNSDQQGNFDVSASGPSGNLFGIQRDRVYDVKNIAAYLGTDPNRRNTFLNRKSGAQLLDDGLFVGLKKVPTDPAGWASAPFEAQYLKLYDVSAPSTPSPQMPHPYAYSIGNKVTFTWNGDPNINPNYKVTLTVNGVTSTSTTTATSFTYTGNFGDNVSVSVQAINQDNTQAVSGTSSASPLLKLLDPSGDQDGDGMTNAAEDIAGTNPLDPTSRFQVIGVNRVAATSVIVTWSSVAGKQYQVERASNPAGAYTPVSGLVPATSSMTTYTDTSGTLPPVFYRVRVLQ